MQLSSPRGLESCNPGRQHPNEYHQSLRTRGFLTISHVSLCFPLVCVGFRRPGLLLSSPRGPDNCDPVALYISLSRSVTLPPSPCNLSHLSKATLWSVAATGVPRELGKRSHFTKVAQGVRAGLAGHKIDVADRPLYHQKRNGKARGHCTGWLRQRRRRASDTQSLDKGHWPPC